MHRNFKFSKLTSWNGEWAGGWGAGELKGVQVPRCVPESAVISDIYVPLEYISETWLGYGELLLGTCRSFRDFVFSRNADFKYKLVS